MGLVNKGYNVILFVGKEEGISNTLPCTVQILKSFNSGFLKNSYHALTAFFKAVLINPRRSYKLLLLERNNGVTMKRSLKNILINQPLLSENLDWLHFGYATLVVNREYVSKAMDAQMAVSFRGFDMYLSPLKHNNCYESLYKQPVKYHVLSDEMKRLLVSNNVASSQIHVISPAIDIKKFNRGDRIHNSSTLHILTVARLHWVKGLDYTLEALYHLKKLGIPFKYTLIGSGEERERLIFSAYQLGIIDQIELLGKQPHEMVKEVMMQADIYMQYSIQEGFCNAVLEAQAMGLLTIVSDSGGLKENVLDNETGWVVAKRSPILLANKIKEVVDMPEIEKTKIRSQAKQRVSSQFNLKQQQEKFIEFYKQPVAKSKRL